jgi:hypothetical protein
VNTPPSRAAVLALLGLSACDAPKALLDRMFGQKPVEETEAPAPAAKAPSPSGGETFQSNASPDYGVPDTGNLSAAGTPRQAKKPVAAPAEPPLPPRPVPNPPVE